MSNNKQSPAENIVILADIISRLKHSISFKAKVIFYRNRRKLKKFITSKLDDSVSSSRIDHYEYLP